MRKITGLVLLAFCSSLLFSGCGKGDKLYQQGMELAQEGNYQEAAEKLEKALGENKERAEYYIGYGMILNRLGEYETALTQFEKAHQDTENSIANANNKQVFYGEAISYFHLSEYEKSLELCDKALELSEPSSMNADILCSKGIILEVQGDNDGAMEQYGKAVKTDSKNWEAYLKRAALYERQNQWEEAKADYQKVMEGNGREKYDAYFALYELCQKQGEQDTSEQILKEINQTEKKEKDPFVLCQIGKAYQYQGDVEQASQYFQKALEKNYPEAEYYMGMLAMSQKEYSGVKSHMEAYLENGAGEYAAMAYNQLAGCSMEQGDYEKAKEYLETGLKTGYGEQRLPLWKNEVILLEKEGSFRQARKLAKEYLSVCPEDEDMAKELEFIKTRIKKKKTKKQEIVQ